MGKMVYKTLSFFIMALMIMGIGFQKQAARAQETFMVTRGDDPIPAEEGTLRWAVQQANAVSGVDRVRIDSELIGFTERNDGVLEAVIELNDQIDVTESVTIDDSPNNSDIEKTRIIGSGTSRIFAFSPIAQEQYSHLTLLDIDLTNGKTAAPGNVQSCGRDSGQGGAICALGNIILRRVTITDSSTSGDDAAGGAVWSSASVDLITSRISGNATFGVGANGGGISALEVACNQSIIEDNHTDGRSALGGGVHADISVEGRYCRISGNKTKGRSAHGGGIATGELRSLRGAGFNISSNHADGVESRGGAAFVARLDITQTTFSDNADSLGRQLYIQTDDSSTNLSRIIQSTIVTGNRTAIVLDNQSGDKAFALEIKNSALVTNSNNNLSEVIEPGLVVSGETASVALFQQSNFPDDWTEDLARGIYFSELKTPGICAVSLGEVLDPVRENFECMAGHEPAAQFNELLVNNANKSFISSTHVEGRGPGYERVVAGDPDIGAIESSSSVRYFHTAPQVIYGEDIIVEYLISQGSTCTRSGMPGTQWNTFESFSPDGPFVPDSFFPDHDIFFGSVFADTDHLDLNALNLTVDDLPIDVQLVLDCESTSGVAGISREVRISDIEIIPRSGVINKFFLNPDTVQQGDDVTIDWFVIPDPQGANKTCQASGLPGTAWDGAVALNGSLTIDTSVLQPGEFNVILTCTTPSLPPVSEARSLIVTQPPLQFEQFEVLPDSVIQGDAVTIAWNVTAPDTITCQASGLPGTAWSGPVPPNGILTIDTGVLQPGVFDVTLTCTNTDFISVSETRNLIVTQQLLIEQFELLPASVEQGDAVTIAWNVIPVDGTTCQASGLPGTAWAGAVGPNGALAIDTSSLQPGMFDATLTCTRDSDTFVSETRELEVTQSPLLIEQFEVLPASVEQGDAVSIAWNVIPVDGTTCQASGLSGTAWAGAIAPNGSLAIDTSVLQPGMFDVTLTCMRGSDTVTESNILEVLFRSTELDIMAAAIAVATPGRNFVKFEVSNTGLENAVDVQFSAIEPENYEIVAGYSLAPSCAIEPAGSGEVRCGVELIPDWQCTASGQLTCTLTVLPVNGIAGVVVELQGNGTSVLTGSVAAVNANAVSTQFEISNIEAQ